MLGRAAYYPITILEMVKFWCPKAKILQAAHKEFGRGLLYRGGETWKALSEHERDVLGHFLHLRVTDNALNLTEPVTVAYRYKTKELTFNSEKKQYDERAL